MDETNNDLEKEMFRKWFRRVLLEAGYSPDAHLYEICPLYLFLGRPDERRKKIIAARLFYESLLPLEKEIFIFEILEKGRHYPFWNYGLLSDEETEKKSDEILRRAYKALRYQA